MENIHHYYQQNAQVFFNTTAFLDVTQLYAAFLALLPQNAHLLDAGCGSGRDTKAFVARGHKVTAFDACSELVTLASQHTGITIQHTTFANFTSTIPFDGIWACASLLHEPYNELGNTLCHLGQYLKRNGYFYCSFKTAGYQPSNEDRHFTYLNHDDLQTLLTNSPLSIHQHWLTQDVREDRQQQWFNVILRKDK